MIDASTQDVAAAVRDATGGLVADACYGLDRADEAYRRVLGGTRDRVVLLPAAPLA